MLVTWIGLMQVNFPIKSLSDFKVNKDGMIQCQIEGWMHRDEARVIEKTLQGRKNILELGTYQGLSTSIIASFCNSDATITTVLLHDMHLPGVQGQTYKFASMMRIRNLGIGQLW